ncbi:MAG: universal stress protein [Gemmatimonadetes bacterium]|nr:universal stress protein [Gemmatimonadota bacterium]
MTRSILVPLDGSAISERAIPVAAALARHHHAHLHLVRVFLPLTARAVNAPPLDPTFDEEQRARAARALQRMARRIHRATQLEVSPQVRVGHTIDEIEAAAREVSADLVVMTTHGRGGVSRAWLGSVTETLLRHLHVPVLVTRQRLDLSTMLARGVPFTKVLLPVDGTPESEEVIDDVSRLLHGVPLDLTLAHVVSPSPVMLANLEDASAVHAVEHEYLMPLAAKWRDERRAVHTVVLTANSAARALADLAHAGAFDLIAMRTHARHGIARFALGSVADKLLRLTTRPVYVRGPERS